jgi:hypothetical protein
VGSEVELVLHRLEENGALFVPGIVVHARGVEIEDLPVQHLLAAPDVANPVQQLLPIAPAAKVLQPGVVHSEALDQILTEPFGGPDAELRRHAGTHSIAQRDDHVEIVELDGPP